MTTTEIARGMLIALDIDNFGSTEAPWTYRTPINCARLEPYIEAMVAAGWAPDTPELEELIMGEQQEIADKYAQWGSLYRELNHEIEEIFNSGDEPQ